MSTLYIYTLGMEAETLLGTVEAATILEAQAIATEKYGNDCLMLTCPIDSPEMQKVVNE
jgi:hypothetical protein